jgi:ribosomal protein S18 acetylase RimI-like enzyme
MGAWEGNDVEIVTRAMVRRDTPFIAEIDKVCGGDWGIRDLMHILKGRFVRCIVAECDGLIVGFVILSTNPLTGTIERIVVVPQYRKIGIGTKLVAAAEGIMDYRQPRAEVAERNLVAQLFFKANGYLCARPDGGNFKFTRGKPITIPPGTYARFMETMY